MEHNPALNKMLGKVVCDNRSVSLSLSAVFVRKERDGEQPLKELNLASARPVPQANNYSANGEHGEGS